MTKVIFDGNNIGHIAFHRAKSIVAKESELEKNQIQEYLEQNLDKIEGMTYLVFFRKLHKLMKKFKGSQFVMTWDSKDAGQWRKEFFPGYKSGRVYTEDVTWTVLFKVLDELREVLKYYPIYQIKQDGFEADDIIYTLCTRDFKDQESVVISTDSDLVQIAQNTKTVKVYHPLKDKFVSPPKTYDLKLYKAIKGEKSDDIPGIKGYGDKRAAKAAELFKNDFDKAWEQFDLEQQEIIERNYLLIDISSNPNINDVEFSEEDFISHINKVDFDSIKKFYFEKKLVSLLESFDNILPVLS